MLKDILSRCPKVDCYGDNDDEPFHNYRLRVPAQIKALLACSYAKVVGFKPTADSQVALNVLNNI